ncbi:S26 family signal peptidase [Streptomyces sp. NPDC090075]|uniref:S26 family signal peptidase n=1 Tax=Streptomyces sp. NPDC090075 TaxID=3365937 RepID=UPI0037F1DDFA
MRRPAFPRLWRPPKSWLSCEKRSWVKIADSLEGLLAAASLMILLITWWLRGKSKAGPPVFIVDVQGHSMEPLYHSGDRVLATGYIRRNGIRSGTVVIVRSPEPAGGLFLKEVVAVAGDPIPELFRGRATVGDDTVVPTAHMLVLGRHPASRDSKQWGYLHESSIHGQVVFRVSTAPMAKA